MEIDRFLTLRKLRDKRLVRKMALRWKINHDLRGVVKATTLMTFNKHMNRHLNCHGLVDWIAKFNK